MITNRIILEKTAKLVAASRLIAQTIHVVRILPKVPSTGVVMCHLKNARDYLPHFLSHYRKAGVQHFVFIENESSDGTKEALINEPDCDVFLCTSDFNSSCHGMVWHNIVMGRYQEAPWILHVDIDEFAVYEGWPNLNIDEFVARCNQRGLSAISAIMIDMYSDGPLVKSPHIRDSKNLFEDFGYFDNEGYQRISNLNWRSTDFPRQIIGEGPSRRIFKYKGHGWLAKTPLITEPGIIFLDPHTVLPIGLNFFYPLIALLHFRLNGDLIDKINKVKKLGYAPGSLTEYYSIGEHLSKEQEFSFYYSGSEKFRDVSQLIEADLIRSPSSRDLFVD